MYFFLASGLLAGDLQFSGCFQLFIEIQIEFNAFSIYSVYL